MKRMIPNGFGGPGVSMGMVEVDDSAPRIIPPERAAKVEHVRHVIEAHRHPAEWARIAFRLARELRALHHAFDDRGERSDVAKQEAQSALDEYDRAKGQGT